MVKNYTTEARRHGEMITLILPQIILNFPSKCPSPFLDGEGLRVRQTSKITPKQSW
jgi:hypothetical protein